MPQDGTESQKVNKSYAHLGPILAQNPPKIDPEAKQKCDVFFDGLLDWLLRQLGANLAQTWRPKPSQNGIQTVF